MTELLLWAVAASMSGLALGFSGGALWAFWSGRPRRHVTEADIPAEVVEECKRLGMFQEVASTHLVLDPPRDEVIGRDQYTGPRRARLAKLQGEP